jgi:predicted Ser/Thr protein kinase
MEPAELKEKQPELVVGEEPLTTEEGAVKITSIPGNAQLPSALSTEAECEPLLHELPQEETNAKEEEPTLVLTVMDILAGLYLVMAFLVVTASALFLGPDAGPYGTVQLRFILAHVFVIINLFIGTYWLHDVVSKLHKARSDRGFWPSVDKFACVNPCLVMGFFVLVSYLLRSFGDSANIPAIGILIGMGMTFVGLPLALRWLYLVLGLFYQCSHVIKNHVQKNSGQTKLFGVIAALSLMGSLNASFGPEAVLATTLLSGLCFIALRNAILRVNSVQHPAFALTTSSGNKTGEEVVLKYNHFVELQKWFKQRFALRSPWKLGVLILILVAAIACKLHLLLLGLTGIANWAILIPGATAPTSEAAGRALTPNSIANAGVVMAFAMTMFSIAIAAFWAFIRAPKQLAAGPDGLRLRFSKISGREDLFVPWYGVKHIKVERPTGKTSAASDRLVFERHLLKPFAIKLAAISSADDREKLLAAIDRFAPQISREAAIEETLRKPMEHNYTELWLQALAAPPKREKLKPLVAGAQLDDNRYQVERELGAGGQGFAYLATDQRTGTRVVLKEFVLPVFVDINARRQSLENFEKEAKLMTRLDHPQVVKLEDFFVEDHRAYLVLEHIDGENLRQIVLRDGPLNEDRIKELATQMCSILSYLHGLSPPLVHRDFTPDNLILRKDGTLKLIDFNVAQQVEYATTGTVVGKQAYLPPEQFRGQAEPASDLYALGATLYFLASAKDPTPISISKPIKDGLKVSPALDLLITSLTQMEPGARTSTAQAVLDILQATGQENSSPEHGE